MMKKDSFLLSSGRVCRWESPRVFLLRHYLVLTFLQEQGEPTEAEEIEMLTHALSEARQFAEKLLKNPEAFVLVHSGRSSRRVRGWHIHIVLIASRWQKAWLYFVLAGKNILQAVGLRGGSSRSDNGN